MHFSEDDLRAALKRRDPGAPFTQRVMARIHQAESKPSSSRQTSKSFFSLWRVLQLRTALACVLVAALALAGWLGLAHHRRTQERRAAEQAILALKITTSKLNYVLERVKVSPAREIRIRRESL
jgi:anti-sigma-K factor RskA